MLIASGLVAAVPVPASAATAPANDNFSQARALALAGTVTQALTLATRQVHEPTLPGTLPAPFDDGSVWFSYRPTTAGLFDLRLRSGCPEPLDRPERSPVSVGIYQGNSLASLQLLGGAVAGDCGLQRVKALRVVVGRRYVIQVVGRSLPSGLPPNAKFSLTWRMLTVDANPQNRSAATATPLALQGSFATTRIGNGSIWYSLSTKRAALLIADTCGSSGATTLTLIQNSHTVAPNGDEQCATTFELKAKLAYFLRVHVASIASTALLHWQLAGATACANAAGCVTAVRTHRSLKSSGIKHPMNSVVPTVACQTLDPAHGTRTIELGYTARMPAESPIDGDNHFVFDNPGGASQFVTNRGQPSTFIAEPDHTAQPHPSVFTITVPIAAEVTWILRNKAGGLSLSEPGLVFFDEFEERLQTGHPPPCTSPLTQWVTVQSDTSTFLDSTFVDEENDGDSGLLTNGSVQFDVRLQNPSGFLKSRCAPGGTPLAPDVLFGYDYRAPSTLVGTLDGPNLVPLAAPDIVRVDPDGFERSHTSVREVLDTQRPPHDFGQFGTTSLGLAWVDVIADVIGRCDFGGDVVESAYPMWVMPTGEFNDYVISTNADDQALQPFGSTPDDLAIGGGVRFR